MTKKYFDDAVKDYAKRYEISVLKNGVPKSIQQLTTDIYNYEKENQVEDGLFPFLKINW